MGVTTHVIMGASTTDDGSRRRARAWTTRWWQARGYQVTIGETDGPRWCKADAYNQAAAASTADVLVIADADSIPRPRALDRAVDHAAAGGWAVPFRKVRRLTPDATDTLLACDPATQDEPAVRVLAQAPHDALPGGGVVVMHRDIWGQVGGFDPRFRGWGGEDYALGCALRTLAGPALMCGGNLWHLWHTPQPDCRAASPATDALGWRYRKAKFKPDAMRALIGEWR